MAPSAASATLGDLPPSKRLKTGDVQNDIYDASLENEIRPHPLRIKPSGNALTSQHSLRDCSTGLFALFSDELILQLLGFLDSAALNAIGATSKGMYGFSRAEELWKSLFIEYVQHPSESVSNIDMATVLLTLHMYKYIPKYYCT
jgi:hypothetical protein